MKKLALPILMTFLWCNALCAQITGSETINFSTTDNTNLGSTVNDGEGGSTDIVGVQINIVAIDASGNATNADLIYNATVIGFGANIEEGLSIGNDPATAGWRGLKITTADGSEFNFNGFESWEFSFTGAVTLNVRGYKNGVATGSGPTAITTAIGDRKEHPASDFPDADFGEVDEVRIIAATDYFGTFDIFSFGAATQPNAAPTLTAFSGPVETTTEDTGIEITFAELAALGDEADSDGTIDAFAVQAVSSGTLTINGAAFDATFNNLINAAFAATWTPPSGQTGTLNAFTVKAVDDDAAESSTGVQAQVQVNSGTPSIEFSATSSSGSESVSSANLQVALSATSANTVTVDYAVTGTTSGSGTDYTLADGTLTINSGNQNANITIAGIVDDAILEANETVIVTLSNPTNATLGTNTTHTYTINDDDNAAVTIADVSGAENGGDITVTATLDNAVQGGFTVDMSSTDGTATTSDSDYSAVSGETLTFAGTAGETQTFTITPTADTRLEANETLTISQSNLSATTLSIDITDGATVTLNNDDNAAVTIADVSGAENGGDITVTATLDNAVQGGFTVDMSSADGTATTGDSDYTAVLGQTLTFAGTAGETQTFTITPTADTKLEANETLTISQSNLSATTLSVDITDGATVTLNNDDTSTLSIEDVTKDEGNSGTTTYTFTVTLTGAVDQSVSVDYATSDGTATTADNDYMAVSGTLTFAGNDGETQTFNVIVNGDTKGEQDEAFTITLSSIVDGGKGVTFLGGNTATGTITNDEDITPPSGYSVTWDDTEINANEVNNVSFTYTSAEISSILSYQVSSDNAETINGAVTVTKSTDKINLDLSALSDGTLTLTVILTDPAGNTGTPATDQADLDTSGPTGTTVETITTDTGAQNDDAITNDNTLSFSGSAEAGSIVEVFIDGTSIGAVGPTSAGDWTFDHTGTTLADGTYALSASATDPFGNQGVVSSELSVTVDTGSPGVSLSGTSAAVVSGVFTITATFDEPIVDFNPNADLSVTNGSASSATVVSNDKAFSWDITPSSDGLVTVSIAAGVGTDRAGNNNTAATDLVRMFDGTPLEFTSTPLIEVNAGDDYSYEITTNDDNAVIVTATTKPDWLTFKEPQFTVSTFAGSGFSGSAPGVGSSASFSFPSDVAVDASGNLYVTDAGNHKIRKITPEGEVTTFAGSGSEGNIDAKGSAASFNIPLALAVDASGNVYVSDVLNYKIRKITPEGEVTTFAGSGSVGDTDANGSSASFDRPGGIAVDASKNVYVADWGNHKIRKINPEGEVTTFAGSGSKGSTDDTGSLASFNEPTGVAVDASGNVYVADAGNHKIRKITPEGEVTTFAGSGNKGNTEGSGTDASFSFPTDVAVDASGNVYVVDAGNHKIWKITPRGEVTTIAGSGESGSAEGNGLAASFDSPRKVALNASGNLYIADYFNHKIRKIEKSAPYILSGNSAGQVGDHSVVLKADDGKGGTAEQSFTVSVLNETPTDIALDVTSIDENSVVNQKVGDFSTVDADVDDTHTYSLVVGTGDTHNAKFLIDGTGLLASESFNHETNDSFSVRIQTDDGKGGTFQKAFVITINDINEAPFDLALSNDEIDETDETGFLIGVMTVMDPDEGETLTYSLVQGEGDANNLLFTFSGNELKTAAAIDFEETSTLTIRVRVTDAGGLTSEKAFSITVNNVEIEPLRDFTKDEQATRVKNFFTPNGDGTNDLWIIEDILDNPINEVKVYSQAGKLVFSQRNYENDWDGTFDGEPIPPGTYYYEINIYNGESIIRGFLTILRN